jgi:hypothetical protein
LQVKQLKFSAIVAWFIFAAVCAAQTIGVINNEPLTPPAEHGVAALKQALRNRGYAISEHEEDAQFSIFLSETKNGAPESLSITVSKVHGKPALLLKGADSTGLMYAALDTAERIANSSGPNPFANIHDQTESPYLRVRGISTYTMQRAYFEQRLYDARYWERYFDLLAASRINSFVLIFGYENGGFMAPPYPYFFNTPAFDQVTLVGISPEQQAKNVAAFQALLRIAHSRGVQVTAGIWDHIYRGGVQGGGIPGASEDAGKRVPGLVFGLNAENLSAYTKASLRKFLEVFPDLDGIQFRMHDESGLKREEMQPFWHDVFSAMKRDHPKLRLDLRVKDLPDAVINDAIELGLNSQVSTKFWMEQMGLPFHPTHINDQDQKNRRHGYADLLRYPQTYRVHWQLWSGGTARVLLWGDPNYVRRFAESARLYDGQSFEVNEMLATKMLGEPHDETPLPILNPKYRYYEYEFERYWYFFRLWGRLTYDPKSAPDIWQPEFTKRFGSEAGLHVMRGIGLASQVLPRIVAASYLYRNFPTTRGWAEMNRQGSLPQYAKDDGSDVQQFLNVREEAKRILAGGDTAMRTPEETSRWFEQTADQIYSEIEQAEKNIGSHSSNEYRSTITDLRILAGLARYHRWRLLAGVDYNLYQQSHDLAWFDEAIRSEGMAIQAWKSMMDAAGDVYSENLAFGAHAVGFSRHWKEEYALLCEDFTKLKAERMSAAGKANAGPHALPVGTLAPPVVELLPPGDAEQGRPLTIRARVHAPKGMLSIRLRYRHVTQFEDYQNADMVLDKGSGEYRGTVPAAFIDPKWNLMYFVEVIGGDHAGRMYPDLEEEQPYVIVNVKR